MSKKTIRNLLICIFLILSVFIVNYSVQQYYTNRKVDEIISHGIIRVGTTGDYMPMSYFDQKTSTYTGFDTGLAEDLAKSLNVKLEYIPTSWPTLLEDTTAEKFDVAICGITITKERKKTAFMSKGYLKNGKTILCRKEDTDKYNSLTSINNKNVRIMENPGGTNEKFVRENLKNATLIIHNVNNEIPDLIAQGKADVMITENTEAYFYSNKDKRLAVPLAERLLSQGKIGILISPQNKFLVNYINKFIRQEQQSGRLNELTQKYIYQR